MFVQVVESFAYGTAKSVKQLSKWIVENESEVTIFYGYRDGTNLELNTIDSRIKLVQLPGKGPLKHLVNTVFLRRQISDKVTIIHGHSTFGGAYVKLSALFNRNKSADVKVLYSPRGYSFLRKDKNFISRCFFYSFEYLTSALAITVACGPSEESIARNFLGSVVRINNSIELHGCDVESTNKVPFEFDVVTIGRISYQKGFDIFCKLAKELQDLNFLWVGSCDKSDEHYLSDVPENVKIETYMEHNKLLDLISMSQFVLLPSRWEGLSRVLIETLSIGKAIITSDFSSNVDCMFKENGKVLNGFICKTHDEYVKSIRTLVNNKELASKMGDSSKHYFEREFQIFEIKKKWFSLYEIKTHTRD